MTGGDGEEEEGKGQGLWPVLPASLTAGKIQFQFAFLPLLPASVVGVAD